MADQITPSRDITRLIEIMAALRTPVTGCPWDLQQTFATIMPYTIEETYEVADAIERGDLVDLKDELGDLLLQVVYHARMAQEIGAFDFGDVVEGVTRKMIRRHPHVFGDETARSADDVNGLWARIKAEERAEMAAARPPSNAGRIDPREAPIKSILADVPAALPALARAIKLQDKAAKVGFDWPSLAPVFEKAREELAEFEDVALPHDPRGGADAPPVKQSPSPQKGNEDAIKEEFGDLLFVLANVARHLKIDPDAALRSANQKFVRRFTHIEQRLAAQGSSPERSSLAEMDALWDEAKVNEKAKG